MYWYFPNLIITENYYGKNDRYIYIEATIIKSN